MGWTIQNAYLCLRQRVPRPLLQILYNLHLNRLVGWANPENSSQYCWPLHGRLQGLKMRLPRLEDRQYAQSNYDSQESEVLAKLVVPGSVCLDVGAHLGYYSLMIGLLAGPAGHVFAFEALPENAQYLRGNVALNGYDNRITILNVAATDGTTPEVALRIGPSSFESSICVERNIEAPMVRVSALALDEFLREHARCDFIKMDIEGGEVGALQGVRQSLLRLHPTIMLELHPGAHHAVDTLLECGYKLLDLHMSPVARSKICGSFRHCIALPQERE